MDTLINIMLAGTAFAVCVLLAWWAIENDPRGADDGVE